MTAPLLATLLLLSTPDCTRLSSLAADAYAAARQHAEQTGTAVRSLREARDCTLQQADTTAAAILHMQEIYLLSLSSAGGAYEQSLADFFGTFRPRQAPVQYAWVMRKQAMLEALRGNAAEAFALLHRALAMTLPTRPAERAETHLRIAEVHHTLSQYEAATAHIRQAEALIERHLTGAARERQRVRLLITRAEMLLQWHALEDVGPEVLAEARAAAEQAYALRERATASDRIHVQHLLGDVLTYAGENAQAHVLLRQAVEQSRGGEQYEHLMALYRLGRNRLRTGDHAGARSAFEAAFTSAIEQGDLRWAVRIRHDQGRLEMRSGRAEEAKSRYREAIELVEAIRAEIGTSEWAASSVSDWQAPYRGLARALVAQDSLAAALDVLEQSRARHLAALQARFNRIGSLGREEAARADSLVAVLPALRNRLHAATGAEAARLRAEAAAVQTSLDQIVGAPPPKAALDLRAMQNALRRDGRVMLYYVMDRADRLFAEEHTAYALVLSADSLAMRRLDLRPDELLQRLADVGPALRDDEQAAGTAAFSLDALHALYRDLFAPVAPLLPAGAPLTIIPDGPLFAVPFAALVTAPAGRFAYGRASYLLDRHPLSIDLSLALPTVAPSEGTLDLLAVGRSRFTGAQPALAPLPGAAREARTAARFFSHTRVLRDEKATRARFAEVAPQSRIIHFATHALLDGTSPLYHALVLAPDAGSDGRLYLHEIEAMRLRAELVTLSGCNTARGSVRPGEGMAGLQYAFRAIGARSTVSTLWDLSDEAGAELFETFYRELSTGTPRDVALQRAQQSYRQKHPDASPFLWAAPVLYGSAAPLPVTPAPAGRTSLLLLAAGLLSFLSFLIWRRHHTIRPKHAADPTF